MDPLEAVGVNAAQIEFWNGPAGDKWARLADVQDRMLESLGAAAMDACDVHPGHTVLDIGCGSGTTTFEIARRVGSGGRVLGVDLSAPMLDVGRARLDALGVEGVTFENKDIASYQFEKNTFDRAFSRFGVMFFFDPVAAFANIRSGLKSDGRLAFVCWQAPEKNPWLRIPFKVALQYIPAPPPVDPAAPGPLAFADPDRVRAILSEAGFGEITIEPLETLVPMDTDVSGSVKKLVELGPVSGLLTDVPDEVVAQIENDIGVEISEFQTDDGVMMETGTWIVRATSP